jgi:hypothetical protein
MVSISFILFFVQKICVNKQQICGGHYKGIHLIEYGIKYEKKLGNQTDDDPGVG